MCGSHAAASRSQESSFRSQLRAGPPLKLMKAGTNTASASTRLNSRIHACTNKLSHNPVKKSSVPPRLPPQGFGLSQMIYATTIYKQEYTYTGDAVRILCKASHVCLLLGEHKGHHDTPLPMNVSYDFSSSTALPVA